MKALTKILIVFKGEALTAAWDEVFLCAVGNNRRRTVVNSCAGIYYTARSFGVHLVLEGEILDKEWSPKGSRGTKCWMCSLVMKNPSVCFISAYDTEGTRP